jgi:hypothetical protein
MPPRNTLQHVAQTAPSERPVGTAAAETRVSRSDERGRRCGDLGVDERAHRVADEVRAPDTDRGAVRSRKTADGPP